MALRTIWSAIYQTVEEQRQIIDRLKRYEDITYSLVCHRFVSLQQELAGILRPAPEGPVVNERRVQERRKVQRRGITDRRKGI